MKANKKAFILSMRVIAGKAKGHQLKVPKRTNTRPATDLVRGAIFSILENITSDWAQVLDLFSGSGALGIEALSRGAGWVDFVEQNSRCCGIIRQNLEKTKLAAKAHLYCCSVAKALSFLDKEYSIILMDPPYSDPSISNIVTRLATSKLVGTSSILVVTHSSRLPLNATYPPLNLIKEHRHGDSCIAVYQKENKS
jgi:16S rRNA (guanine(966)-N(2))-methyltransferase RsmD|tara:strand:+ start:181 stop:768 length:588 start_codon:yes stop_codon:yes gene_type:complete